MCQALKCTQLPWSDRAAFAKDATELGLFLAFLWSSTSYELVIKYPQLKPRVHWVLGKIAGLKPEWFKGKLSL